MYLLSIGQIAGWSFQKSLVLLPRSMKRSGALLGSNSVRNRTAVNDDKSYVERLPEEVVVPVL